MTKLEKELERLVMGAKSHLKLPRGFAFWSMRMQIAWLKDQQR
jgi:hypothetical protein